MARRSLLLRSRVVARQLGYVRIVSALLIILYAVGIAGHLYAPTKPLMLAMTPWFLLLCGLVVVWPSLNEGGSRFFWWVLGTYLFTFAMEALGVATGLVFGSYIYGPVLGFGLLGVPLVIAFNWVLVVYGALRLAQRLVRPVWLLALLTAALATAFDWIMEPLAIRLNYWRWAGGDIPTQNYIAWFVIAFLATLVYSWLLGSRRGSEIRRAPGRAAGTLAIVYLVIQTLFFAGIRLGWLLGFGQ